MPSSTTSSSCTSPDPSHLTIPSKPTAPISYTFFPGANPSSSPSTHLIIFINGLGLPAASWTPSINILRTKLPSHPACLTYDRYGQGLTTARDPIDGSPGKEDGHDFLDVVADLHEIINVIAATKFSFADDAKDIENGKLQLLMIGSSIGCPIIRLYAQHHSGLVSGAIFLDSNIANANFSDFLPDPDDPSFTPDMVVADDCTLMQYRGARDRLAAMFDLGVKNAENLDRRSGRTLLPSAESPKLVGPAGKGPWLNVVGHDPEVFAESGLERMGTPKSLTMRFTNPYWAKYNKGLTRITDPERCQGVAIAKGCGHFIHSDDPEFVAGEVMSIIEKLGW
ncbi:Uncharacterized protein BP5553_10335 [Venustampulla echinocandica]|uniref:AB hydrolase-1 domain-containing protein n=1 Tax=Venustampulla echinocandica TaxID=2656787 RepID=A0A370T9V9_9HELO|nr:Uncharacterized protein BP5553_10335 [Venustampulla echinocandica]RDL30457.1 Uncharacterized protein BP5553_10335 [Venustampulla echinocandica]